MSHPERSARLGAFLAEHLSLSRRYFLRFGMAGVVAWGTSSSAFATSRRDERLQSAIDRLETWLTSPDDFRDVSRGNPLPHSLSEEQRTAAGLTRETWRLDVVSDSDHPSRLRKQLKREDGTALDFPGLMKLAETRAVRFPKVMTCLNIGCPLGTGLWEGVPLRDVLWLAQPVENLRRVFYYGYHNDDPAQMFRSSLPVGRVLEDPFDLPPVILCYKLNGQWLTPERGGPVRVVVPEAYGFKSIKWLSTLVLSNIAHSNDTYENGNNDVDSPLKSFAATLSVPTEVRPQEPFALTGYAQVGIAGVKRVQISIQDSREEAPSGDPYFTQATWLDTEILAPPATWGGGLPDDRIPNATHGFDPDSGQPRTWPMRLTKVHWAILHPGLAAGTYTLRSRTIDDNGHAQPMPRPFKKSGHAAIEQVSLKVAESD